MKKFLLFFLIVVATLGFALYKDFMGLRSIYFEKYVKPMLDKYVSPAVRTFMSWIEKVPVVGHMLKIVRLGMARNEEILLWKQEFLESLIEEKKELMRLRAELERKRAELEKWQKALAEERKRLDQEWETLKKEKEEFLKTKGKLEDLVKLVKQMDPSDAARILGQLDTEELILVLKMLPTKTVVEILTLLPTAKASEITRRLGGFVKE